MNTIKFDETDRRATILALENRLGIQLAPVGRRRKWLRDKDGRSYWVLVGYGEWHGIPEEMVDAEAKRPTAAQLVIATREREALRIFVGRSSLWFAIDASSIAHERPQVTISSRSSRKATGFTSIRSLARRYAS